MHSLFTSMSIRFLIFSCLLRDTLYFRVAVLSSSSSNSEYRERERKKEDAVENNEGFSQNSVPFPSIPPPPSSLVYLFIWEREAL